MGMAGQLTEGHHHPIALLWDRFRPGRDRIDGTEQHITLAILRFHREPRLWLGD
jgi:hypothetical protein